MGISHRYPYIVLMPQFVLSPIDPNTKKATSIYAVVYFKRKQYKINTGVKVYPSQWNKKGNWL